MNNERIVFLDTENTGLSPQNGNHRLMILLVLSTFLEILRGQLFKQP
ncbi:MAG: hypothetical protein ACJAXS_001971 [Colwellia sp.]|jgi:uncharacterized protein YprB with RNaseH-like and TPR domain